MDTKSGIEIVSENIISVNENLSFLKSSEHPLSADVYFIKGEKHTYIVDVGSNDEAFAIINSIPDKKVIITHFHEDHTGNLKRLEIPDEDVFVGNYAGKYLGKGTVVGEPMVIPDGVKIGIVPIPNSHAKGSLCVTVDEEYLILGDAFYSNVKGYNVSLLGEEIRLLESLRFDKVLMSHKERPHSREEVFSVLNKIFSQREKEKPYIPVYDD
ncbi:MAG: MBL fold metallo-hydrolase [Lachnospiraceae bacterium]|nr:MBL fold metallo-hydrolase [Lachnospiraceae bacterium]